MTTHNTESPTITWNALPTVIRTYLTAHRDRDVATAISAFTADAEVTDEGHTIRGRDEIGTWLGSAGGEYTYTTTFTGAVTTDPAHLDVVQRLEGELPGRGGRPALPVHAGRRPDQPTGDRALTCAKNWFITGGTPGGFGMAYAEAALDIGDRVVLTARRPEELDTWAAGVRRPRSRPAPRRHR